MNHFLPATIAFCLGAATATIRTYPYRKPDAGMNRQPDAGRTRRPDVGPGRRRTSSLVFINTYSQHVAGMTPQPIASTTPQPDAGTTRQSLDFNNERTTVALQTGNFNNSGTLIVQYARPFRIDSSTCGH